MIITHFPNTLGGVSFEKLVNYLGEGKPNFFDAQFFLPPNPQPFLATTKGDSPLETPKLMFSFYFCYQWLSLLAIQLSICLSRHTKSAAEGRLWLSQNFRQKLLVYKVGHGGPITAKLEFSLENSNRDKNYRT